MERVEYLNYGERLETLDVHCQLSPRVFIFDEPLIRPTTCICLTNKYRTEAMSCHRPSRLSRTTAVCV